MHDYDEAVQFFYTHASLSNPAAREMSLAEWQHERLVCAQRLAKAEGWRYQHGWHSAWNLEEDGWRCLLFNDRGLVTVSKTGIHLVLPSSPATDPETRTIEAEIADSARQADVCAF